MSIKIFLIEDNLDHVLITKDVLTLASKDWQIDSTGDPQEGLKMIIDKDYDLVLCDYRLPGLSALDVLKKMKEKGKDLPFIVVTSAGSERIAVDIMKEGAYDYVVKDDMYEETLPLIVRKALERHNVKKEKERVEGELKIAYAKLKEAQSQLIQAEKMQAIGRMASGVAHEIKNPLGIILQGIGYLEQQIPETQTTNFDTLQLIKQNVHRADSIVRALVDFSKLSEVGLQLENINSILEAALTLKEYGFKSKNIKIVKELKDDLPKVLIDKGKIEQVFINLLLNARQAMSKGGELHIRSYQKQFTTPKPGVDNSTEDFIKPGEKVVVVEIQDTGVGIAAKDLSKIFEPFFTTKRTSAEEKGTGLGLYITKNIIDMHKGLLEIQSEKGKGTTISVILKVQKG
ncbi:ATP-binding protein [Candidatus Omnitrophota bacterium]